MAYSTYNTFEYITMVYTPHKNEINCGISNELKAVVPC